MKKLSLIAALALGGLLACCTLATAQETNKDTTAKKGKRGMMTVEQRLDRMSTELELKDDQKPKVKAVLEDTGKQMQALRDLPQDERRTKMQSIREDENKKLKDILTPDQYEKYQKMMAEMRGKKGEKKKSE